MLCYLKDASDVDYVIVHKLDRLARNRADDVEINRAFDEAGVRLVSTSENIDQPPGGILLHGIMSSIAEFYSRNLANEVIKGMSEKARNGGTNRQGAPGLPRHPLPDRPAHQPGEPAPPAPPGRLFCGRLVVFPGGDIMRAVRGVVLSAFPGCGARGCQGRWGAGPVVMAPGSPPGAPGGVGRGGIGGPVVGGGPGGGAVPAPPSPLRPDGASRMVGRRLACRDALGLLGPLMFRWITCVPLDHRIS